MKTGVCGLKSVLISDFRSPTSIVLLTSSLVLRFELPCLRPLNPEPGTIVLKFQSKKPAIQGFQQFGLNKLLVPKSRVLPFPTVTEKLSEIR